MNSLNVDLQDGFNNDLVIIRVNEQEIFHKKGVQTNLLLSYADAVEVEVPEGIIKVETILPSKKLSKTIDLQISAQVYLGISIQEGGEGIQYRVSNEPFGYM